MGSFIPTLEQTAFLFTFIIVGFILTKAGFLPDGTAKVLSKLENLVFIPALVFITFANNLNIERIKTAYIPMLVSVAILLLSIPIAILASRLLTRDGYERNIYTYGLVFSNFGFMGNAVVKALFPEIFLEYLLFSMPMWVGIYMWGAPSLLMGGAGEHKTIKDRLKSFVNPMFIAMVVGAVVGLCEIPLPSFLSNAFTVAGDCMSPIAMLLTGATVAAIGFKRLFLNYKVYIASAIRLVALPLLFYFVTRLVSLDTVSLTCTAAFMCMPLGLNTIVIPGAYGKDTSLGAAMAIVSHILGCITIPLMMLLFNL